MKLLLDSTGTLLTYPRADGEPVEGLDPSLKMVEVTQDPEPTYDIATHMLEATEVIDPVSLTVTRGWKVVERPVPPAPPAPLTPQQKLENLGITLGDLTALVTMVETKPWDAAAAYLVGMRVTHSGKTWIATSDNTGNEPDDVAGDWSPVR